MRVNRKMAIALLEYAGFSRDVAATQSKNLGARLSQIVSGKSRGEKKQFYTALRSMAAGEGTPERQIEVIRGIATKGKEGFGRIAADLRVDTTVGRIQRQKNLNTSMQEFGHQLDETLSRQVDDMFKNIDVDNIIRDVQKEMLHDTRILGGRMLAYPVNKLRALTLSSAFRKSAGELVRLPKGQFGESYYQQLVSSKGLAGRAPTGIEVTQEGAKTSIMQAIYGGNKPNCQGGFNLMTNTIEFTREFPTLSRAQQANLLTHELRHFEQSDIMIRTFGIDRYVSAIKNRAFNTLKLQSKGQKSDAEIMQLVEKGFKEENLGETIRKAFASSSKAPRIDINSEVGQRAKTYLEATENYQGVTSSGPFGMFMNVSEDYLKNPLEVEAYKAGRKAASRVGIMENLNLSSV